MSQIDRQRQLEQKVQVALERAKERRLRHAALARSPRYDEVFCEGVAWLDRLASCDRWHTEEPGDIEG